MILLLTKDLFFMPVLQSAGANVGVNVIAAPSAAAPRLQDLDAHSVTAVVVDLSSYDVAEIIALAAELRGQYHAATLAGFGPHVQTGKLEAAREAGYDQVLTRGQLNNQLADLVRDWANA